MMIRESDSGKSLHPLGCSRHPKSLLQLPIFSSKPESASGGTVFGLDGVKTALDDIGVLL
jgi:hypothetical protein